MNRHNDYSINFASTAGTNGKIVIPGESQPPATGACKKKQDDVDGVVITPDSSSIVIKTRLMKEKQNNFSFDNGNLDDSYVPPSLSNITQINSGDSESTENSDNKGKDDTKVFLNICTHPLIAVPGQRKGLDEQTGKEIDGWRLPMSMGDLRPCYDKTGNAAIVADCTLNPKVVREMNLDSNHFQFVCDLIVQCASRKFGHTWFGGLELDRRFKLPKMKYAGYVDELTGLPILPDHNRAADQKAVVAKQRVKGHGGKSIIQEVESNPPTPIAPPGTEGVVSTQLLQPSQDDTRAMTKVETSKIEIRIELFIGNGSRHNLPLFDFLGLAADEELIVPLGQPCSTLRDLIKSPKLMPNENDILHESQLLTSPIPFDITSVSNASKLPGSNRLEENESNGEAKLDYWYIVAKCSILPNTPPANLTTPTVDLSAFLLVLSTSDSKTECILPFPVDTHKTGVTYNSTTVVVEIHMPLLQPALHVDAGPDPGTRPWELQNALGGGKSSGATYYKGNKRESACCNEADDSSQQMFGSYFLDSEIDDEDNDGMQPLPEDAFHSQDVLSRHLLQQQEEEREERSAKGRHNRDGADVEYIDVDKFRPKPRNDEAKEDCKSSTLKKAQSVMKTNLRDHGSMVASDLVFGLV
ncbi:hypothetical protein ACHAXR_012875 [Thalassiosira sp. AJA248-18]